MSETPDHQDNTPHRHRDASAQLEVTSHVGDAAQLREAMDPANRSLAEALQLSFRLLQAAILVLLVLFLFSGFKTIETNQSGVATVWGKISESEGLEPGLRMNWPPPVGEFVLFQAEGRTIDDGDVFRTRGLGVKGREMEVRTAKANDRIKPERDGSFLTAAGEIGHMASEARYEVIDATRFLETVPDGDADNLVKLALQQATVAIAAKHTLTQLRQDFSADTLRSMLRSGAQRMLDATNCGIRIAEVSLLDEPKPPLFLQKSFEEFSKARQQVEADIEAARQEAQERLIGVAGEHYTEIEHLLNEYEAAWGDETAKGEVLDRIHALLASGKISGQVSKALSAAERYRTEIERTLGSEARRFASLRGEWEVHPELIIAERILGARGRLMASESAELVMVPEGLGSLRLDISGLQHVRDARRRTDLQRRSDETWGGTLGTAVDTYRRIGELKGDKAARQMVIDESGRLRGMREDR
ncbi:MAG: SPFH domain-containing protein [Phycisphaerales bacterium]|jgi:regulator of protease activity HflC (stomatin/prohibitin superfamily)|nr:SPFH domain-containing protein [Phycisphaerales bacterium]